MTSPKIRLRDVWATGRVDTKASRSNLEAECRLVGKLLLSRGRQR